MSKHYYITPAVRVKPVNYEEVVCGSKYNETDLTEIIVHDNDEIDL